MVWPARVEVGKFAALMGRPQVHRGTKLSTPPLRLGTALYYGDRIETGDADKAEIQFNDGTTIRLNFNTTLEIPRGRGLNRHPQSGLTRPREVKLLLGHIWTKVQKTKNAPQFAVRTPIASATVKGTEFGLKLQKANSDKSASTNSQPAALTAVLTVKEGAVEFSNELGKVKATGLTESTATLDSAPSHPRPLNTLKSFSVGPGKALTIHGYPVGSNFGESASLLVYPLGWLGLSWDLTPLQLPQLASDPLPQVTRVWHGSPAENAGLERGDVIVAVNGEPANKWAVRALMFRRSNTLVHLTVLYAGVTKTVSLTTTTDPDGLPLPDLPAGLAEELFDATWKLLAAGFQGQINSSQGVEAEASLTRLLTIHPDAAAVHNNLAVLYETKGEFEKAIQHLHQAIQFDPDKPLYHANLGRSLRSIGNFERMAEELEVAVRLAPNWAHTAGYLSEAYSFLGRHEEALAAVERGLSANPLSFDLWGDKSSVLLKSGKPAEALQAELKAVELNPFSAGAQNSLGLVYWTLGKNDAAETAYRRAIELNPNLADAYGNLGLLFVARLDIPEEDLWAPTYDDLGVERFKNIDPATRAIMAEAERLFRKAIELKPDAAVIYVNLGQLCSMGGEPVEAEKMVRKAIEIDPGPGAYNALAWSLAVYGTNLNEALDLARKAVEADEADPQSWNYLFTLASVHFRRGELNEAEMALKKYLELRGHDEGGWYELGRVYERKNQPLAAKALYEKALSFNPDYPKASRALQQLGR